MLTSYGSGLTLLSQVATINTVQSVAANTLYAIAAINSASGTGLIQLQPNAAVTGTLTYTTSISAMYVGYDDAYGSEYFPGPICEVLFYPATLSAGDIATIHGIQQQVWNTQ